MRRLLPAIASSLLLMSCVRVESVLYSDLVSESAAAPSMCLEAHVIPEVWRTQALPADNVDSVAVWRNAAGDVHLLLATCKTTDRLLLFDASNGEFIRPVGSSGSGPGQFARPNGIVVKDDLVFVVERDNRRVQVLRAPSMESILTFGEEQLRYPYGIDVVKNADGSLAVFVTDDYERPAVIADALPLLGERVKQYRLDFMGSMLTASFERAFGDTTEAGALLKVESILADPETGLLFIGDEDRDDVKVYTMEGTFDGRTLGTGVIREDSEGIAILPDPNAAEGGYLVVTEQRPDISRFHVFSREGSQHLGVVTGDPRIANTDGITIVTGDFGQFRKGALIAVHDDMSVAAYSFGDILESLGVSE